MNWLQRIAVAPLVFGLQLVILAVFAVACMSAFLKWLFK